MKSNYSQLLLRQLDAKLKPWRETSLPARPPTGWVRAIRQGLGMSSAALGKRLNITDSAIRKMEEAEASDAITLGTLRRAARALDCELQYALIPKESLEEKLQAQAHKVAQQRVQTIAHSMALEDQAVNSALVEQQVQALTQELLIKRNKGLW